MGGRWDRDGVGMIQVEHKIPRITMRISILTVFLSLVLGSFFIILAYMGVKNRDVIEELSESVMLEARTDLNNNVEELFKALEKLVLTGATLFSSSDQISIQNEQLRSYMLSVIQNYPNVAQFYIAIEDGDSILSDNLTLLNPNSKSSRYSVPVSKGAAYSWELRKRSEGRPEEIFYYYDKDMVALYSETRYPTDPFDPKSRPWYKGAAEKKSLYWTDIYTFFETNNPGITVSKPLYDSHGNLLGVMAADLSFELLSEYFSEQKIRTSGKPFILDSQGNIIIPTPDRVDASPISKDTVAKAFQIYHEKAESFFKFEMNGTDYLCSLEPFPMKAQKELLMAIIVPEAEFFSSLESIQRSVLLMIIAILIIAILVVVYLAKRLSKPIVLLAEEVDKVRQLDFSNEVRVDSRIKEIYLMDEAIALMRSAMHSFTCYIPKEIVRALFSQNKEIALGGEKTEVTVLFSDIEGFTSITEEQPTEALMSLLAEYFDSLSKIILESHGTIDKYIGDSVMAFWGAPTPLPDHVQVSAQAVLRCKAFVREFNRRCKEKNLPLFKTRFGINSGVAIVGNIGTPERMNYTLIGDVVNTASRMQNKNKDYGTTILIGEAVYQKLGDQFLMRPIDVVELRGRKEKTKLYELIAMKEGPKEILATPQEIELCTRFAKAYEAVQENQLSEAKKLFEALAKDFPDDRPTQVYLERLR